MLCFIKSGPHFSCAQGGEDPQQSLYSNSQVTLSAKWHGPYCFIYINTEVITADTACVNSDSVIDSPV